MTLSKLKQSEQILFAIVIIVLVIGAYSFFRFLPKNDKISQLQYQAKKTERKLLSTRIPNEPQQNVAELLKQLDDQEKALALTISMADSITQHLAPFNSQELKVRISELARNTGMRIKTNEAFTPPVQTVLNKQKNKAKRKAALPTNQANLILPVNRSWIDRMSAQTIFHRPIQRLVLEGNYPSLRAFVHGLEKLDWQVTIVRLDVEALPLVPVHGFAQLLTAELVLAL